MISIVGSSPTEYQPKGERWVFNYKAATEPASVAFQMHKEVNWGGGFYRRWMRDNETVPIYMREKHEEIPMSTAYPFQEVFEMTKHVRHKGKPLEYFTSSIAWAIALAVLQERKVIELCGIDMNEYEYVLQANCFSFWTGFAAGRGTRLEINCASNIFEKQLYGAQPLE